MVDSFLVVVIVIEVDFYVEILQAYNEMIRVIVLVIEIDVIIKD